MPRNTIDVAVVGGGVAGLTLAIGLTRAGLRCRVYEQAAEFREIGAGVQLSPNSTRLLHRLGAAEPLDAIAVKPAGVVARHWATGALLRSTPLGRMCEEMYGAPFYCVHRAELHAVLRGLVPPGTVRLGTRCVGVTDHPDGAGMRFADGSAETADVVVGADGICSVVREALESDTPRFSGKSAYRGLIPADRLPGSSTEAQVRLWLGPDRHLVHYPVSRGRWISFAAITPAADSRAETWTTPGRARDLRTAYEGWHSDVQEFFAAAGAVTRWALHDRAPIGRWHRGRITLVGDAAHPMLPFGAQGASQAIEDAAALTACLRGAGPGREQITSALRRYGEVRRARTGDVQRMVQEKSRTHHYFDGAEQRERDRTSHQREGLRQREWLYGYEAEAAVLR
ncbi:MULTISPECIES: FAD-dependent monooxygenase [Actinomadura]|uniref:FAD-dependent monooxygenase n=1 Tax=Actinomadura yumaensis TaxID=111807 RepID=A0ABW2CMZ9_9ACTN|nr:FAD-dependent monooxygenase [Actinomadura sp. J1-007]MWK38783.1 FAD-binding protein [Actinomadura sp. J1-007]